MANARVRLSQQTIDSVAELGQQCGIDDHDTVIKLLIRKYGDQLASLLAPDNPNTVRLSHSVPTVASIDPILTSTAPVLTSTHTEPIAIPVEKPSPEPTIATVAESPADELARLRALKPMERMKHSSRITELKELLEA